MKGFETYKYTQLILYLTVIKKIKIVIKWYLSIYKVDEKNRVNISIPFFHARPPHSTIWGLPPILFSVTNTLF